jgi:hypothetical protein
MGTIVNLSNLRLFPSDKVFLFPEALLPGS